MSVNLQDLLKQGITASEKAKEVLLHYYGNLANVQEKELAGLVSEADLNAEKEIINYLKSQNPEYSFLAEEESFAKKDEASDNQENPSDFKWIIDPLDGTTNYIYKLPFYCTSIALEYKSEIVVGVINVPYLNRVYTAIKGNGAFMNGEKISVSNRIELKSTLLATGFYGENETLVDEQIQRFSKVLKQVRAVRRVGSAAIDLAFVAEGVYDGYWESHLSPWDTAAGMLLVSEAGGKVTTYDGGKYSPYDKTILASNDKIHDYLESTLAGH